MSFPFHATRWVSHWTCFFRGKGWKVGRENDTRGRVGQSSRTKFLALYAKLSVVMASRDYPLGTRTRDHKSRLALDLQLEAFSGASGGGFME